jgi:predicted nucleotide-binding protein
MDIGKIYHKCINYMKTKKISLVSEEQINNGKDKKLIFDNGVVIVIYHTGNYVIQGKIESGESRNIRTSLDEYMKELDDNKIFIVYGHDKSARDALELMLRKWGLKPVILEEVVTTGSQTIIEKLEEQIQGCSYGIVIATPDDIGGSASASAELCYRVRQNVVLELGMLMTSINMGRNRIMILMNNDNLDRKFEKPSDIDGLIYISFEKSVTEREHQIYKQLKAAGFEIAEES